MQEREKICKKNRPILSKHWLELIFLNDNENYVFELEKNCWQIVDATTDRREGSQKGVRIKKTHHILSRTPCT